MMSDLNLNDDLSQAIAKNMEEYLWHSMALRSAPLIKSTTNHERMRDNVWGKDEKSQNVFWDWLVQAGWRQNVIQHDKCNGAVTVMLVHEACGKVIESRMLHALSDKEAEELGSLGYVRKKIREHKAYDKGNGCKKAIPKGEADEEV